MSCHCNVTTFLFEESASAHPEDGQNDAADFLLLRVGQDVGQDGNDAEPGVETKIKLTDASQRRRFARAARVPNI